MVFRGRRRRKQLLLAGAYACIAAVFAYLIYGIATKPSESTPTRAAVPTVTVKKHPRRKHAPTTPIFSLPRLRISWPAGRPLRVLFIGDSLTAGWGATTEEHSFRRLVETALARHGQVEELRPTRKPGTGLTFANSFADIPTDADVAVIELGTTDADKRPSSDFARDYAADIARIRSANRSVRLICLSVWRPTKDPTGQVANNTIGDLCSDRYSVYVDITALFDLSSLRGPQGRETWQGVGDDFHPNDAGHRAIADAILSQLKYS